jgi:hypothetical protein
MKRAEGQMKQKERMRETDRPPSTLRTAHLERAMLCTHSSLIVSVYHLGHTGEHEGKIKMAEYHNTECKA